MCERCPKFFPIKDFPIHSNLIGMVQEIIVVNHCYEITTEKIIKEAYEHEAVYDAEDENEEIIEYFFVLFGEPGALLKGYTKEEINKELTSNPEEVLTETEEVKNVERLSFNEQFSDHPPLKPGQQCPACYDSGDVLDNSGNVVKCELCLRSGR